MVPPMKSTRRERFVLLKQELRFRLRCLRFSMGVRRTIRRMERRRNMDQHIIR